jgi:hypothetical protein
MLIKKKEVGILIYGKDKSFVTGLKLWRKRLRDK